MTTPPDREMDATQRLQDPPWSAPRPDGPLARALRLADARRAARQPDHRDRTTHASSTQPALEHEIESLAREARSRDEAREALALALEWPEEPKVALGRQRHHAWLGWGALVAAVLLAVTAAFVAVLWSPPEARTPARPAERGLKMDPHLSQPAASLSR